MDWKKYLHFPGKSPDKKEEESEKGRVDDEAKEKLRKPSERGSSGQRGMSFSLANDYSDEPEGYGAEGPDSSAPPPPRGRRA
jgi:hypothetical protein